jgi:hypothetical protein
MPRCLNCKQKFEPKRFLQKHCESADCEKSAQQYLDDKIAKALKTVKQKKKQEWNKEKIEIKEKLKTLSEWHNDLQKEINAIVRELDRDHPCISSQRSLGKSYDAGHLFGRQSNPQIRYHLFNIFAQSVHDNQWKSGNQLEFVDGIEKTFGTEIKEYCLSLKGFPELKMSVDDIKEKIPISRSILKWVKLQERKFTTEDRISLRKRFNQEIGIYNQ